MPLKAIARLIQTMLYGRRFFPYYVHNILGGIEADGKSVDHLLWLTPDCPYTSGCFDIGSRSEALMLMQELELFTLSILSEVMKEKRAELLELLNRWFSLS